MCWNSIWPVPSCGSAPASPGGRAWRRPEPDGLAWAFLAAGAPGVIVSSWVVDDAATTELMAAFYAGLAGRCLPAGRCGRPRALDGARPHPYFWAAFPTSPPGLEKPESGHD